MAEDGAAENDLFEHNLRLVRESYRRKVHGLENEVARLKSELRDRENHIEESERDWNRKAARYEGELQEAAFKHKALSDEKDALAQENANLKNELRQTKKSLAKLQVFKRAIQSTIEEEDHRQQGGQEEDLSEISVDDSVHRASRSDEGPARSYTSASRAAANGTYGNVDSPYSTTAAASTGAPAASSAVSPGYAASRSYSATSSPDAERADGVRDVMQQIDRTLQNTPQKSPAGPSPLSDRVKQILQYDDLSQSLPVRGAKPDQPSEEKVFFQEARQRLSWNQFNVILANIKRLNANEQTKDTTLEIAKKIFGEENSDLYWTFRKLLTRGEKL